MSGSFQELSSPERAAIWVRCDSAEKTKLLLELEDALQSDSAQIWFEVTLAQAAGASIAHPKTSSEVRSFCKELQPSVILWVGGQLDPTTLNIAFENEIPVLVLDAGIAMLPKMGRGWFPGKTRSLLSQLEQVFARTADAADGLVKAGVRETHIQVTGSLEETGSLLQCDETERYELAQAIGPRPIWLAACVGRQEMHAVVSAHRQAALRTHRLLCIVNPIDDPQDAATVFQDLGFSVGIASDGDKISESTQVFITEQNDDLGLWLRLAPISFVGGSLDDGARLDPFQIAAVGSVVIHGRQLGRFGGRFNRLVSGKASFLCERPIDLGPAVAHFLSPEKAAALAHAGWAVTSQGAEVMNTVAEGIQNVLIATRNADA